MPVTARTWLLIAALGLLSLSAAEALSAPPLEPEISDVATLPPSSPHRFFTAKLRNSSFVIFDGDSGKMEGNIPAGYIANLAIAPDNSQFFVSETYWAHGARGERQDLLSVYDSRTLNLVKEIPLPGRALVMKMQNFDISASGSRAYVYIMLPASFSAVRHGSIVLCTKSSTSDSSLARVSFMFKCLGPAASAVMYGRLISVC